MYTTQLIWLSSKCKNQNFWLMNHFTAHESEFTKPTKTHRSQFALHWLLHQSPWPHYTHLLTCHDLRRKMTLRRVLHTSREPRTSSTIFQQLHFQVRFSPNTTTTLATRLRGHLKMPWLRDQATAKRFEQQGQVPGRWLEPTWLGTQATKVMRHSTTSDR